MLEKIKNPCDIKKLNQDELKQLADDVRKRIIEVTAKNGGHIAPSLGVTDLTIALLKVFNPLKNKIVWDVGHQSYAYKILTERNENFATLRQFGGISGFNNIFESKYDAFGVGHASTSISATLGITIANEKHNIREHTIAVIGDGALSGGMAFEAVNHAGHLQKNMIVILNDNNMSISKSVGALQSYLTNILVSRSYNTAKNIIWDIIQHLPSRIRRRAIMSARKIEENLINTLAPNIIFEDLGFHYLGPIDGHDIPRMMRIFHKVKHNISGPVFIHVVTKKGKGYTHAEDDAPRFHGLGPFEVESGKPKKKNKQESYSNVVGNTLCEIAKDNENIIGITAAMVDGTGLTEFAEKFPDRFFDVGIAEQHAVTFAGGLATQSLKPFVVIYSTFLQRAFDQIVHDIALQKLPVVFCLDRAGLVGEDGATHHGTFDLSYLQIIPNLVIMAPVNAEELIAMMKFAEKYSYGPIAIRYPRGTAFNSKKKIEKIELGKFEVQQKGKKIALIGIGKGFQIASEIYELIQKEFGKSYLINARFAKPIDHNLLQILEKEVEQIFTFEDNSLIGGFGSNIKNYFVNSKVKVHSFGLPDEFIPHGKTEKLYDFINFTTKKIYPKIKDNLQNFSTNK